MKITTKDILWALVIGFLVIFVIRTLAYQILPAFVRFWGGTLIMVGLIIVAAFAIADNDKARSRNRY